MQAFYKNSLFILEQYVVQSEKSSWYGTLKNFPSSLLHTSSENLLLIAGRDFVVSEAMLTPLGHAARSTHIKGAEQRRRSSVQQRAVTYVAVEAGWHLEEGSKNLITHTAESYCKGGEGNTLCGLTTHAVHKYSIHVITVLCSDWTYCTRLMHPKFCLEDELSADTLQNRLSTSVSHILDTEWVTSISSDDWFTSVSTIFDEIHWIPSHIKANKVHIFYSVLHLECKNTHKSTSKHSFTLVEAFGFIVLVFWSHKHQM